MKADRPRSFHINVALVLFIIGLVGPTWADYEAGTIAYQRADYATALREWRPLAEQGHADAQYHLGLCYDFSKGVSQDFATARQWYEKAAVQGHAGAQANLGSLYNSGRGAPQDFMLAVTWYRRSADRGNEVAQRRLGLMYERGSGVPQDLAKRMTSAQLFQAQQRAREWKPKVHGATTAHKQDLRKSKR